MKNLAIQRILRIVLSLLFVGLMIEFNYFLDRKDFDALLLLFASGFAIYLLLIYGPFQKLHHHFKWLISLAILSRIIILFALPNLSDDYFRFLWDGHLTLLGISPYQYLPNEIVRLNLIQSEYAMELFRQMNSPNYYSVYPPINQIIFTIANFCFPNSIAGGVIVIKVFMLGFEMVSIYTLFLMAQKFKLSEHAVLLYALNPLVIIEFCGNLHFEGVLISFLLISLYLLTQQRWKLAALPFAAAVLTKLHPLMLFPFIIKYLGWKNGFLFAAMVGTIVLIFFSPFVLPYSDPIQQFGNLFTSIKLYFETFEFNGGIYYLLRAIGSKIYGYNPIYLVGKLLLVINIIGLTYVFFKQRAGIQALTKSIVLAYLLYVLLSTTVHPWYILTLLPFSLLLRYKLALVWSATIIISYFAYSTNDWHENFYLLILEYSFVFIFIMYDFYRAKKLNEIHR
jgi:hypothetical protein